MTKPNVPSFLVPPSPGALSNKRGSNTSSDALQPKAHFANPLGGSSDSLGCMRVQALRTARYGTQLQTPEPVWDSGWTGTPPAQSIPTAASEGEPVCCTYGGRVYVLFLGNDSAGGTGNCWSAPLTGGGCGAWRTEANLGPVTRWDFWATSYSAGATQMVGMNGWVYAGVSTNNATTVAKLMGAPVGSDGKLGAWQYIADFPYNVHSGAMLCGGEVRSSKVWGPGGLVDVPQAAFIWEGGGKNTSGTVIPQCSAGSFWQDGTPWLVAGYTNNIWKAEPNLYGGYALQRGVAWYDENCQAVYVIGGDDGTTCTNQVIGATFNPSVYSGMLSAFYNLNAMPAVRTNHALAVAADSSGHARFEVYGGSSTAAGSWQSSIYFCDINGPLSIGTWSAAGFSLPATGAGIIAWTGNRPGEAWASPDIGTNEMGGASGATAARAWTAYMYTGSSVRIGDTHGASPSFRTGDAPGLTLTDIGGVGSITTNADQSKDVAFDYGGWGGAKLALSDGDQVQFNVQWIGVKGDASAVGATLIKIGQPPTIGSVSPANGATPANGQPALSFVYSPGAGGAAQQTWRVQLKQGVGGATVLDTGTRYDQADAVSPLTVAPLLLPSQQYQLIIDVNSLDTPMSGSADTANSTTTFTTTAFTTPGTP